ncbi:uncharacterized protein LOC106091952 isoform X3 [Stomoxys calcitrans]|uniref:uncharacterized protein LOC106091952 isoform X3 n=1 Tax=Stomoxys calcitrans TaxID=35570 RepID=UPI0027E345E3|nr:uncharacterized protein LOC106091952 isoform X3 [Stomoxys calcitrans]
MKIVNFQPYYPELVNEVSSNSSSSKISNFIHISNKTRTNYNKSSSNSSSNINFQAIRPCHHFHLNLCYFHIRLNANTLEAWRQRTRTCRNIFMANMFVFIIIILIVNACIAGTIPATPENITVTFLTPTTVRVSWQTMIDLNAHPVEKYIVTYKPTDDSYRVMQDVAGNSEAIILDRLTPGTQYSIVVSAVWLGKKYRSRQVIFRTLDLPPKPYAQQDSGGDGGSLILAGGAGASAIGSGRGGSNSNGSGAYNEDGVTSTATNSLSHGTHRELPTIRGVEIGIVLIVLMVWAGAIALFFNRWGKIRMLLPYQPDYKHEQLKVPGTGVCSGGVCNGQHSHQHFHVFQEEHSASISERITRSRINSAIFVSSEGRGFDSIEFLRRHGSQSVLCRKAKSAENITDNGRKKSFVENRQWHTDDNSGQDAQNENAIELQECSRSVENHPIVALKTNVEKLLAATSVLNHSATVTTSNKVVGSISIETPPSHIREEQQKAVAIPPPPAPPLSSANTASFNSASHDSADTVEELVSIPIDPVTVVPIAPTPAPTVVATSSIIAPAPALVPAIAPAAVLVPALAPAHPLVTALAPAPAPTPISSVVVSRPRGLVRQRSSTASPVLSSAHSSPKALKLKCITPKISNLPMVSVSGPSPSDEKPPPSDCL